MKLPQVVVGLCRRYDIPVTPRTVLSHAEVQAKLGIKQRGKWDISRLAFDPSVKGAKSCNDVLRASVPLSWLANQMSGSARTVPINTTIAARSHTPCASLDVIFRNIDAPSLAQNWGCRPRLAGREAAWPAAARCPGGRRAVSD